MESRLRILFLRTTALALLVPLAGCGLIGRDGAADIEDADASAPVIDPAVERRAVKPPKIDSENFEVTAFAGLISVEDFGSNTVYGARLAYHVSEGLFAEASYGTTSDVDKTSVEVLTNVDLLGDDRELSYYDVSLGWNLLPGEVFFGGKRAFNSALYVLAGAGNVSFGGDDLFAVTLGTGYRVLATDSIAVHFDIRDRMFDNDVTGEDKTTHNIEFALGLSWFF